LPVDGKISIKIFDILGRHVTTLIDGSCKAGKYEVQWDASRYASGVYIYKIIANDFVQSKKMLLIK
jgi:serine protease